MEAEQAVTEDAVEYRLYFARADAGCLHLQFCCHVMMPACALQSTTTGALATMLLTRTAMRAFSDACRAIV
jgi:hypothetical protein